MVRNVSSTEYIRAFSSKSEKWFWTYNSVNIILI